MVGGDYVMMKRQLHGQLVDPWVRPQEAQRNFIEKQVSQSDAYNIAILGLHFEERFVAVEPAERLSIG